MNTILNKDGNDNEKEENKSLTTITGELKVQMINFEYGEKVKIRDLKLKIRLGGYNSEYKERIIDLKKIDNYELAFRNPIIDIFKESLSDSIEVRLVGIKEDNTAIQFGKQLMEWKGCFKFPNKWGYKKEMIFSKSKAFLHLKWITQDSPEFKSVGKNNIYLEEIFTTKKNTNKKGILKIIVNSLIYTPINKDTSIELILNENKQTIKGDQCILKEKDIYTINKTIEFPINIISNQKVDCLKFLVKNKKNLISKVNINFLENINFENEWSHHRAFPLFDSSNTKKKEKLYLKTCFNSDNNSNKEDDISRGVLKIFLIKLEDVPGDESGIFGGKKTSDPYVSFEYKNSNDKIISIKTKEIKENLNPEYYQNLTVLLDYKKHGSVPPITIKIFDYDLTGDDLLCTYNFNLNNLIKNKLSWVKQELNMDIEEKYKQLNNKTKLFMEMYYVPEGEHDTNPPPPSEKDKNVYINFKGELFLNIVSVQNLIILNSNNIREDFSTKNFIVKAILNKKKFESKTLRNNQNQLVNFNNKFDVEYPNEDKIENIKLEIYEKKGLFSSNKLMSKIELNWKDLISDKGNWAINKIFEINGNDEILYKNKVKNMGELYIQAKFVQDGMVNNNKEPDFILDKELFVNKTDVIKGELEIKLIHCKDLFVADSGLSGSLSDPYVIFSLKDKKKLKSNVIKNTLNPLYNSIYRTQIIYKEKEVDSLDTKIKVEVYDKDYGLNLDDLLGHIEVDFIECIKNPNNWSINKIYDLNYDTSLIKDQKHLNSKNIKNLMNKGQDGIKPQIYLQVRYVLDKTKEVEIPPLLEDISDTINENKRDGTLIMYISHAIGLIKSDSGLEGSLSDPYCKILLPNGIKAKSKVIKNSINPEFKEVILKEFYIEDVRNLKNGKLIVMDKDSFINADDNIGECELDLSDIFNKDNFSLWAIEKKFILNNPKIQKEKKIKSLGYVYMMFKYIPKKINIKQVNTSDYIPQNIKENYNTTMKEAISKGTIHIFASHAKGIMKGDSSLFSSAKSSDPFIEIYFPNKKKEKTKYLNKTTIPIWRESFKQNVELNIYNRPIIKFDVKDHDIILPNDLLGFSELELDEILNNKDKWYDYLLELDGKKEFKKFKKFGDIYIQAIFVSEGKTLPEKPVPKEDIDQIKKDCTKIGTLFINVSHAKNIPIKDSKSSDPYVKITYPDKSTKETKYKKNCLNPVYNQLIKKEIEIENFQIEDLFIEMYDDDFGSFDDFIGFCYVELKEVINSPNKWVINKNFELSLDKSKINTTATSEEEENKEIEEKKFKSEVYLQIGFVPKGGPELQTIEPSEDISKYLEMYRIKGKIIIKLIHCSELLAKDGDTSDPFVIFKLGKSEKKSNVMPKTLNPVFNQEIFFEVDYENETNLDLLKIIVNDKDMLIHDKLGFVDYNLLGAVTEKNKWYFNDVLPLENGEKGEIYLQIGFFDSEIKEIPTAPEPKINLTKILDENKVDCFLHGKILYAANLIEKEKNSYKTLCKIKYLKKEIKSNNLIEGIYPEYNLPFKFDINSLDKNKLMEKKDFQISIEIHKDDVIGTTIYGFIEYNLKDLLLNKNSIFYNDNLILKGIPKLKKNFVDFGIIYIQMGLFDKSTGENNIKFPELKYDLNKLKEKDNIKGNIAYNICYCRDLPVMDTGLKNGLADPFVIIKTPDNKELKTDVIDDTLNPEFNKQYSHPININKMKAMFTQIIVKDKDLTTSDFVGKIKLNLNIIYENPNKWIINDIFKLLSEKDKCDNSYIAKENLEQNKSINIYNNPDIKNEYGFIYIQCGFFDNENISNPPDKLENLEEYLKIKKEKEKIVLNGTLKCHIKGIKGIISRDGWAYGSKSDPYVQIELKGIEKKKTKAYDNTHDVEFNEDLDIKLNNIELKKLGKIIITVFDKDVAFDEFLGDLDYNFIDLFKNINSNLIDGTLELNGEELKKEKNKNSLGTITLKLGYYEN